MNSLQKKDYKQIFFNKKIFSKPYTLRKYFSILHSFGEISMYHLKWETFYILLILFILLKKLVLLYLLLYPIISLLILYRII